MAKHKKEHKMFFLDLKIHFTYIQLQHKHKHQSSQLQHKHKQMTKVDIEFVILSILVDDSTNIDNYAV